MVAPNPKIRVAPSGPLADSEDPPYDALFTDYAGYTFVPNISGPSSGDNGGGTDYMAARIGPSGTLDRSNICNIFLGEGRPVSPSFEDTNIASYDSWRGFNAVPDASFEIANPGLYMVECDLTVGFATGSVTNNDFGLLTFTPILIADDFTTPVSGSSQFGSIGSVRPLGVTGKVNFKAMLEVEQDDLDDNGGPFRGLNIRLGRVSGSGTVGDYNANSGWLQFGRDSTLMVRKYREIVTP